MSNTTADRFPYQPRFTRAHTDSHSLTHSFCFAHRSQQLAGDAATLIAPMRPFGLWKHVLFQKSGDWQLNCTLSAPDAKETTCVCVCVCECACVQDK